MSFLESIKLKQNDLKRTVTLVTYTDGKVYKETKTGTVCIGNKLGFVVDNKPDTIPAKISDFIYLGSQDSCVESVILEYNFKYVLSVGVDAPYKHPNVIYKFVDCLDLPECELQTLLSKCIPFIKTAVNECSNILVHCNAGVSRSAAVVIAYLILIEKFSYTEAFSFVKKSRNCINPNVGFITQLQNFK